MGLPRGSLLRRVGLLIAVGLALPARTATGPQDTLPRTNGWIVCRTANFTLYSDANPGRTRKVAVRLERFRQALGRITRGFELDTRVATSTFVFKNDVVYTPYKYDRSGRLLNVSGYFLPRPFHNYITLDISAGSKPMRVVYHEFFHAVMDASLGTLPTWLNEGLAEYFSTFRARDGAVVEVGHPIPEHVEQMRGRGLIPWDEVFATTTDSPTYNEVARQGSFYAQSWLLVHYLNANDERSRALGRYLSLLRSGRDDEAAFGKAFGKSRAEIGGEAAAYLEKGSNYVWWDFGEEHGEVEVEIEELEPAEVYFRLGELLAQNGRIEAARRHLEAAIAAGWPRPEALSAGGIAAFYAQQPRAAETALREAVAAGAGGVEPDVVLCWILHERFVATPEAQRYSDVVPPAIEEIRQLLDQGLGYAPDDFHALTALARTFLFDPGDAAPGVAALERARRQRPLDLDLLQIHASLLGRAGRAEQAWAVIQREMMPKDPERARETGAFVVNGLTMHALQRVEAGDRDGAVDLLDEALAAIADPRLANDLREMRDVLASGGHIVFSDDTEQASAARTIETYNRAVELASAGKGEEALQILDRLVEDCEEEQICELARQTGSQLRELVERNRLIGRLNEAVAAANGGDRRRAVEILRSLEAEVDDPQMLERVQELLRSLGARVARKK